MQRVMIKNIFKSFGLKGLLTLIALTVALGASAQSITGRVTDESGQPAIGVNVIIKGTQKGVSTSIDGTYSIAAAKDDTLVFSYIGYTDKEVKVGSQTTINVQLTPTENLMEEVVVVGYGSVRRSDLTGSVSSVSAKEVEGYKSASVMEALGGQVAGVQIMAQDGTPGAGFDVKIRGVGTVTGDASPLYIVDGFQVDNIDYLANTDIESIEFLKDASSSAIYGSRAANGVVMVTTKAGKIGKPVVSYSGSASYRHISKQLDVLSPYEFVRLQTDIDSSTAGTYYHEGIDPVTNEPYRYQSVDDYIGLAGVDWQGEAFNPTWSQDHSVSISGGNKTSRYSASFSHYSENGIFENSGFDKTTAKIRLNQQVTKWLTLDATVNYSNSDKRGVATSADAGRFNMLAQIISARPTGGLRYTDEELLALAIDPIELETGESLAQVNPIQQAKSVTNEKRAELWQGNVSLTAEICKGLTFKTAGSYATTNTRTDVFYRNGSKEAYRNGQKPYGQSTMARDLRWANFNYLTYKWKNDDHAFDVMLGQETSFRSTEYVLAQAKDFPTDALGNDNLGLGGTPSKADSEYYDKTLISFFARANYNLKNRYLFTATIRADGSTVFSDNHKWGWFPSFSAAWRISEEPWMKNQHTVSNLKLRAGWGTVGNDRITNYLSLDLYTSSKYGVGSVTNTVLTPKQLAAQDLRWEGSATTNVGLDLGLWRNRLNITLDMFVKNTKDLLLAKSLSYVTGFDSQYQNIGKIQNRGLELAINSVNIQSRSGFTWTTDFNISFIRNELKQLQPGETRMYARSGFDSNFTNYDYVATVGAPLGQIYGFVFDGIYQYDDFVVDAVTGKTVLKEGVTDISTYSGTVEPGFVKYKDINGDGKITTDDRTVIGNALPDWYGGITNTFTWKGVDFSFMFQFNYGNDIYNATRLYATQTKLRRTNKLAEVADRWTETNASNSIPSTTGYVTNDVYSRFVEDGSFLRLKNLTLGYTFPKKWTKKIYVQKLRVYFSAQNLFVVTGYSGYDPEVSVAASKPMTPGLDWGAYPRSRVYTCGLDIQF